MMIQMMKISSKSEACIESPKIHVKIQMAGPHPASYSATLRICPRIYFADKFPDDADAACPGTTL